MFKTTYIDNLFGDLEELLKPISNVTQSFPRYNIYKTDNNTYIIELAVAGYSQDMVDVEVEPVNTRSVPAKLLTITGDAHKSTDEVEYVVRGITGKPFVQKFYIYESDVVESCKMKDGILRITIKRTTPDSEKVKIEVQ